MPKVGATDPATSLEVSHWYDFVCPFCYVAQARNDALRAAGALLVEQPHEAHPETPTGGRYIGPRSGAMYAFLEEQARAAGLELRWPPRIPNAHLALTAAAFVEAEGGKAADRFRGRVFAAHFARGEDIGDPRCIAVCAAEAGIDIDAFRSAVGDGTAARLLAEGEREARRRGVRGTPAWLIGGELVIGLRDASELLARMPCDRV